jgi:arylformamidase
VASGAAYAYPAVPGPWIDLTKPLHNDIEVWPGDPVFQMKRIQALASGDIANVSVLSCSVHTGTHIDAPIHFIEGAPAIEDLPLDALVGPCVVSDSQAVAAERVLYRRPISPEVAAELVHRGTRLVGVADQSVDGPEPPPEHPVHMILLGAGVVVVEGLLLADVEPGDYEMVCLPLRLVGSDGSPARVLLRRP